MLAEMLGDNASPVPSNLPQALTAAALPQCNSRGKPRAGSEAGRGRQKPESRPQNRKAFLRQDPKPREGRHGVFAGGVACSHGRQIRAGPGALNPAHACSWIPLT
jgi:hypothetical protein